jgi:hypothetical protein
MEPVDSGNMVARRLRADLSRKVPRQHVLKLVMQSFASRNFEFQRRIPL